MSYCCWSGVPKVRTNKGQKCAYTNCTVCIMKSDHNSDYFGLISLLKQHGVVWLADRVTDTQHALHVVCLTKQQVREFSTTFAVTMVNMGVTRLRSYAHFFVHVSPYNIFPIPQHTAKLLYYANVYCAVYSGTVAFFLEIKGKLWRSFIFTFTLHFKLNEQYNFQCIPV